MIVNMVGHQTTGPDFRLSPTRRIARQIEVKRMVTLLEKYPLAPVATACVT